MKFAIAAAATIFALPNAFASAPADLDAAVRAFFAKNGVNGVMEFADAAAGAKRALSLPAVPSNVYKAEKYYVLSYDAADAQAQKATLDVFVSGDAGEREVSLVYVSARPVVQEMIEKGRIQKVE